MKERTALANPVDTYQSLRGDIDDTWELWEMAEEDADRETLAELEAQIPQLAARVQRLELEKMLSGPQDDKDAIIDINAGEGGTDAMDWAQILVRMYSRWAERQGYSVEEISVRPGEEAGIKSATITVRGHQAYGYLKAESGVHRVVRHSEFDSSGRRHTSFASVSVYPEIDDTIVVEINDADLRVDTYRASGAGGQHVNKTESAVRITHLPTNIVVTCQNERSQHKNRATAMKILRARIYEAEVRKKREAAEKAAAAKSTIGFGSQIRSYVLQPYRKVKDHRTGVETGNVDAVLDGDIDEFIEGFLLGKRPENTSTSS